MTITKLGLVPRAILRKTRWPNKGLQPDIRWGMVLDVRWVVVVMLVGGRID